MSKDTSGPAFPQPHGWPQLPDNLPWFDGLTIRDYFAAKAMQGILADHSMPEIMDIAGAAYEVADAMIEARKE